MRLQPDTVIDRYRVEALLGEGGMAVVYRVRHEQLGTTHAFKVLKTDRADIQRRLLQEGRVQAKLRHPNVVNVTDVIMMGDTPGLVMEFVEGATLEDLLAQGRLSAPQIEHLAKGILEGVAAAHRAGLIHRDLKPANIMLALDHRDQFVPKITDFGLAKVLDDAAGEGPSDGPTRPNVGFGTPSFMAPEQITNAAGVDHRADIFSMGAILYEMISGVRCFGGTDVVDVLQRVAACRYMPLEERVPTVPTHMWNAVDGALQLDPDERWQDGTDLLMAWREEESNFDNPFSTETSNRMRALGAGTRLEKLPIGDGPTHPNALDPLPPDDSTVPNAMVTSAPPRSPARAARSATPLWLGLGFSTVTAITLGTLAALLGLFVLFALLRDEPGAAPVPSALPDPAPTFQPRPPPPQDEPESTPVAPATPVPATRPEVPVQPPTPPAPPAPRPAPAPTPPPPPVPLVPEPEPEVPPFGQVIVTHTGPVSLINAKGVRVPPGRRVPVGRYEVEATFKKEGRLPTGVFIDLTPGDIEHVECFEEFGSCRIP